MRNFDPSKVPAPPNLEIFDWRHLKGRDVAIEIGAGTGSHAISWAKANSSKFLIAIERTHEKFGKFQKSMREQKNLDNLLAIQADAIWWCSHNLPGQLINEIYMLYPNPYPKKKQSNLRFHNMPFMGFLIEHLKPGGRLIMASNMTFYIEECCEVMVNTWGLKLNEKRAIHISENPRSLFEEKYLLRNENCFNLVFEKYESS